MASLCTQPIVVSMDSQLYRAAHVGDVHTLQLLLQQFYSRELYSHLTPRKNTVLHIAARKGHIDFINEVLKIEPGISGVVNEDGNTALHEAAKEDGHSQVVNILLQHNQNEASILNNDNESALFIASEKGHLGTVRRLLLEVNSPYELMNVPRLSDKRTSFHAAAHGGHLDVVKELLAKTQEIVFNVDISGNTPLHSTSSAGHLEIVKEILALQPAMCYDVNEIGMSALHVAATMGHADVVEELVSCHPDCMEIKSKDGKTALRMAVENNHVKVVNCLLEKKTILDTQFVNEPDNKGNTALHLATMTNLLQMVELLVSCEMVNVKATNKDGFTALDQRIFDELEKAAGTQGFNCKLNLQNRGESIIEGTGGQKAMEDPVSAVVAGLIIQVTFQAVVNIPDWLQKNNTQSLVPPTASNAPQSAFQSNGRYSPNYIHKFLRSNIIAFIFSWCVLLWWTLSAKFHPSCVYRAAFKACMYAALVCVLIAFNAATNALAVLEDYDRIRTISKVSYYVSWAILSIGTLDWFRPHFKSYRWLEKSGLKKKNN